jgi:hypothetical protein
MSTDGNQNERKNLYLLRANEFLLLEYMKKDAELKSHDIKKFSEDKKDRLQTEFGKPINVKVESSEPKLLTPDKIYLQGMIIYKDQDVAVILHQDKLGKNADRLLTCVDAEGNEKWTAPPENFPKYMMQREDKSFSDLFFMKDKFGGMRSGNIFVFKFSDFGLIGFDLETGKKLWEISI